MYLLLVISRAVFVRRSFLTDSPSHCDKIFFKKLSLKGLGFCKQACADAKIVKIIIEICILLAHLSRRLIGELIVYQWSGVRRRRRPSVRRPFTMLKHLLLTNRLADPNQILCGASLGRGNKILFAASGSHDQDGRHAHIW